MSILALFVLALGLSVDAFAAAVGRGTTMDHPHIGVAIRAGLVFGLVEMITPVIGWGLGTAFADLVDEIDHWIAFVLLVGVGGHMAWHALRRGAPDAATEAAPKAGGSLIGLVATAVGTSIDAMAVGVSLALLDVDIRIAAPIIGATTFVVSTIGLRAGKMIGEVVGHWAEAAAGVGLALIGCGILWAHTMV